MVKQLEEEVLTNKFLAHIILIKRLINRSLLSIIPLILTNLGCNIEMNNNISIIPKPEKMKINSGVFVVSPETKIWLKPAGKERCGCYQKQQKSHAR